jgi:amino acid adenylation domain-containing protein
MTAPEPEDWPLSWGQHRLWMLSELAHGPAALNLVMAVRLCGRLHPAAVRHAVDGIAARHPVLRSVFEQRDGEVRQRADPRSRLPFDLVDLTTLPADAADREVDALLAARTRRGVDLRTGPVAGAVLFRCAPDVHVLAVAMHHIVADAWSFGILAAELEARYRSSRQGMPPPPAGRPAAQYRDYVERQRRFVQQHAGGIEERVAHLEGLVGGGLPLDPPPPGPRTHRAGIHTTVLPPSTTAQLADLRRASGGGTPFMLVLTALTIVIGRLDGRRDVAIGTFAAGRSAPEFDRTIGYFVNLLLIRTTFDAAATVRELWRHVRHEALAAYELQDVPYEKLIERLAPDRDPMLSPPVSVLCVMQQPPPVVSLAGLTAEPLDVEHAVARFDLTVEVQERDGSLSLTFQYDTDVLDAATVELLGRCVHGVLAGAAQDVDQRCDQVPLEPPRRRRSATPAAVGRRPGRPDGPGETLHGRFARQARSTPDAVAVSHGDTALTFRALDRRADGLAARLRAAGVGTDDVVGILLPRSPESVVATLGALKAGAGILALDPAQPRARLAALIADAGPRAVVAGQDPPPLPAGAACPVLAVADAGGGPAGPPAPPSSPDQLAYLVYTSGSTGRPKGVAASHRAVLNRLSWMQDTHPYRPGERAAHRAPLGFVDSVTELLGPLLAGVEVHVVDDGDLAEPSRFAAVIAERRLTRIVAVPALLRVLLPALAGRDVPPGVWVSSGEPLPADVAARVHRCCPGTVLLNLYGSTEVAGDATAAVIGAGTRAVPIGTPITGVTAEVLRPDGAPCVALESGELHVGGAAVARGYHRAPGATAARFLPDPAADAPGGRRFRTGDRVRRDAAGRLRFLGRFDDQIQVRGVRVEPGEIEAALLTHPAVAAAAVTAQPDAAGTSTLVGHVVLAEPYDLARLRGHLRGLLAAHLVPSLLTAVDALPRTESGKLDRALLPAPAAPVARTAPRAPRTPAEVLVASSFAALLPVPPSGVDDDFFALGGHSILAIALLHDLHRRCGVELGMNDLFTARTVAGLADLVDRAVPGHAGPQPAGAEVPDGAEHEPFPLTDVQQAYWIGRDSGFPLGSVATHAYLEVDIAGVDVGRLAAALDRLVGRHPALRTVVRPDGLQQVLREVPAVPLRIIDLRTAASAEAGLAEIRDRMSHQVLPADRWPLFDLRLSLLAGGAARLHVSIDALVADAYSVHVLMGELAACYADPGVVLEPPTTTFRAQVLAMLARYGPAARAAARAYWFDRLPGLPRGPELPLRADPATVARPRFRRWSTTLDRASWDRLRDRAAGAGLTPSTVLLAAFCEVLTAWSAGPHYTLNITLFTRDHTGGGARNVVGDFTSLTLLEVDHRGPGSFLSRASGLQRQLWSDLDHRAVGGVEVLREWTRREAGAPRLLVPVVFTSNLGLDEARIPAAPPLGTSGFALTQTPQLYLDHQVAEGPHGLSVSWDAVAELFPDGVVEDMRVAHAELLARLAETGPDWDAPIRAAPPAHQLRRRALVNATARPMPRSRLEQLVAASVARTPDAVAVRTAGRRVTYRELAGTAGRVAAALRDEGVAPGALVGVACRKGPEQIAAVLGVLAAGAGYVPLDPDLPAARLEAMCTATRLGAVVVHGPVRGLPAVPVVVEVPAAAGPGRPWPPPPPCGDTGLAYVIFTSGSTGTPKGVAIDHRGAVNTVLDVNRRHRVGPGDAVLGLSSLSFDLSVYDLFGILAAGGTLVLPDPGRSRDPGHWVELVRGCGVTVWNSVPALLDLAVRHPAGSLEGLRLALLSGDWIPLDLADRVRRRAPGVEVVGLGGATECSIWSVRHRIGRPDPSWTSVPYGRPLANQRVDVLDDDLGPRPDWVPGTLHIGGTGVAVGYRDDPAATARAFPRDPRTGERLYRTGDLARFRPDGSLEFLGRDDQQVKINGNRVELGDVEHALGGVAGVAGCAVAALGPPRGEKRLVGYYVPEAGEPLDPAFLRARLADLLPASLVPSTFVALPALPLTANGKLDRAALTGLPLPDVAAVPCPATRGAGVADRDAVVAWLTRIWQVVLDVEHVHPDDNFFELGGTSLVGVRIVMRIEAERGIRIPLVRVYEAPTVARLADEVAAALAAAPEPSSAGPELVTDPAGRFEPFPLTSIQEAYWLGRSRSQQLGGVATHVYQELDVTGLDLDRLEGAIRAVVARHDALRTVVLADGTQQALADVEPYRVAVTDLTGRAPGAVAAALAAARDRESHRVRAPGAWPLFTVSASRLDARSTRLHIGIDLLIADAQSLLVLQRELLAAYAGQALPAPPGLTFRDYQLTTARRRSLPAHRRAREYWSRRVALLPSTPDLPTVRDPAVVTAPRFARIGGELGPEEWGRLQAAAAARNLTPSGLLCAAFADVLAAWSGRGRFLVNLTTFNRLPLHPDVGRVVGDFTSTTLLAVDATAATFEERAGNLQRQIFSDLEHREFGGVEVLRLMRSDQRLRSSSGAPIVFTSLLVPDPAGAEGPVPVWDAETVHVVGQTSQVLLDHQVGERDGALHYSWDHVAEVYPPGMVEAMHDAYRSVLVALATDGSYWSAAPAWET